MRTFLKIILIISIVFPAIFLLARYAVSFTKFEPHKHTFTIKKPSVLKSITFLALKSDGDENNLPPKINFLILGNPGEGNSAPFLTDTIMLASLNTQNNKIYFFSIPRDLYVRIDDSESFAKINSLYLLGKERNPNSPAEYTIKAVEKVSGQKIDYFATIDLAAIKKIVDDLGGLNVNVSETVNDPRFPTASYRYETFYVEKGWRYFDGELASKYLRTRHSPNGDFDRMRRQQDVVEAFRKKIFGLNLFWDFPKLLKTYSDMENHIVTNIDIEEMKPIYRAVKEIPPENLIYKVIYANQENGLVTTVNMPLENSLFVSIVQPKAGLENYEEIRNFIQNTLDE